ncbi:MAG TPA: DUF6285 domain-containing protein [Stellaceae bacterium]|jgi:hypothetical protein
MIRERPAGPQLLEIAREMLVRELAPLLPSERRGDVLMVASAMAIAAREAAAGAAPELAAAAVLRDLYGDAGAGADGMRGLAADIRAGAFDAPGPRRSAVHALLWEVTKQRLRESNPKLLAAHGLT